MLDVGAGDTEGERMGEKLGVGEELGVAEVQPLLQGLEQARAGVQDPVQCCAPPC